MKVFELAKELDIKALDLIDKVKSLDIKLKNHMVDLDAEQEQRIRDFFAPKKAAPAGGAKKTVVKKTAAKAAPAAPAATSAAKPAASGGVVRKAGAVVRRKKDEEEAEAAAAAEAATLAAEAAAAEEAGQLIEEEAPMMPESSDAAPTYAESTEEEPMAVEASSEALPEESAPVAQEEVPAAPVAPPVMVTTTTQIPGGPTVVRRGPRYSVIRVVKPNEPVRAKPLVVQEAPPPGSQPKTGTSTGVRRSFGEDARPATETAEEIRRKKAPGAGKSDLEGPPSFKSTDFLRRERTYQPKKKKLSIGQNFKKTAVTTAASHKRVIEFDTEITVESLAEQLKIKARELSRKLASMGVEQPDESEGFHDWVLDLETAQLVADAYDHEFNDETYREEEALRLARGESAENAADDANAKPRSPVITIMGHVDHGKTSLLDTIRRARVASGEAGGITQHIGAYTIDTATAIKNLESLSADDETKKKEKKAAKAEKAKGKGAKKAGSGEGSARLTFLDTPGHAAFTAMRARGAKATDIVVLVVAANDGVMPQTREAVDHAKAAGVPIIVAVNKIDLPDANPDKVMQQLSELGLLSEEWGGETLYVKVSAKTGVGVAQLLESIALQSEILELKASAEGYAEGIVLEAKLDKGRGPVCSVLVQSGTLKVGQYAVVGGHTGKIRALIDDKGQQLKEAGPSTPVEVLGMGGVPEAGDILNAVEDERAAKELAEYRQQKRKEEEGSTGPGATLEAVFARHDKDSVVELPIILKSDVKGSAEAIKGSLEKIPQNKVKLRILSTSVGQISANDVLLASASKAIILGFNVRPDNAGLSESERLGVQVKTYTIIYELFDEVKKAMEGLLAPTIREVFMGRAEIREVFNITKVGAIAGCAVTKGKLQRANQVRLLRDGRVLYTGKLASLKRFKDDAREVAEGYECGLSLENYNDLKPGDVVEAFTKEEIRGTLDGAPAATT